MIIHPYAETYRGDAAGVILGVGGDNTGEKHKLFIILSACNIHLYRFHNIIQILILSTVKGV